MTTRAEAIAAAGEVLAEGRRAAAAMTVEEQARAAYTPTGPSIAELEALIRAQRAEATTRRAS